MSSNLPDSILRAVRTHYPVPENLQRIARLAWWDLMYGPLGPIADDGERWPGFQRATEAIGAWLDSRVPSTVYAFAEWEGCSDTHPENWPQEEGQTDEEFWHSVEMECENMWCLEGADLFEALIGHRDLAEYV